MEIIKSTIKVGNSAGVILPRKWLNMQVKVVLEPMNIEKEVVDILLNKGLLRNVLGIYLVGSSARNEQDIDSDIDILVITDSINQKIKQGKYEIICIGKTELETQLKKNILPILPMIKEARAIVNEGLIKDYLSSKITKQNLKYHIETTKSAMGIIKKEITLSDETNGKVSDASAYSLILRLRSIYILECIKKNKIWSKKSFLRLIEKISGSLNAYKRYLSSKNNNTLDYKLQKEEAEKIMNYINKKIIKLENE